MSCSHAPEPLLREKPEPRDESAPLSPWLLGFCGVLLFWAGWYLGNYGGGFSGDVLDENPSARFSGHAASAPSVDPAVLGSRIYVSAACISCHQATGQGDPGRIPPLAGSEWVSDQPARIKRILLHGFIGPVRVKGMEYNSEMPGFAAKLSDQHIAAVLTFIRTNAAWGNNAVPVVPESVAATRLATTDRSQPWTAPELLAINADEYAPPATGPTTGPATRQAK